MQVIRKLMSVLVILGALSAASCSHVCPAPPAAPARTFGFTINNGAQYFVPTWSGGTDMTSTLTSDAFRCSDWTSTSIQVEWPSTGTPVGSFSYQASVNSTTGVDGTFRPVTLTVDVQPTGAAGGDLVDFQSMPWRYLRVIYTPSSGGTGALPTVTFFGKGRVNQ